MKKLIFYTDLDGTLLDHHSYSWDAAKEAIDGIRKGNAELIFNSSKTIEEMKGLQEEIGLSSPMIIENGGAIHIPDGYFTKQYATIVLGKAYEDIIAALSPLKKEFNFKGFADMTIADVTFLTGLSEDKAQLSKMRTSTEPIIWQDSEEKLIEFSSIIEEKGFQIVKGGRFYHVCGLSDKGHALNYLQELYKENYPHDDFVSIALGDSPNDIAMLEAADHSFVVERPEQGYMTDQFNHAGGMGPEGWNRAVLKILAKYS